MKVRPFQNHDWLGYHALDSEKVYDAEIATINGKWGKRRPVFVENYLPEFAATIFILLYEEEYDIQPTKEKK